MAADTIGSSVLARRYAAALLELAEKSGNTSAVEKDLEVFGGLVATHKNLRMATTSPLFSREVQSAIVSGVAKKAGLNELTVRFLTVLVKNRRLGAVADISGAFCKALSAQRGEIRARVETAFALSPAQIGSIRDMIGRNLGAKDIVLDIEINRELLGGIVLTVGSRRIDASVAGRLGRLGRSMMAGAIANDSNTVKREGVL